MTLKEIPKTLVTLIDSKFYIEAERFFYLADHSPPKEIPKSFFFNIDNDLCYQGFFEDFGPLNIAKICKYVIEVQKFLNDQKYADCSFYHFTSPHYTKCVNSALLVCSYLVIVLKRSPEQAYEPFKSVPFRPFRDAGYGQCSYHCTILDCLRGLHYAMKLDWFDYKKFDIAEYEHYEKIENGNLNWIIPGEFLAFSSPTDEPIDDEDNITFRPKDYVTIFKKIGVTAVIRLNNQTYDSNEFKQKGIHHHQLYFPDGTCPSNEIVEKFLEIAEKQPGAKAVHCKAGLGRTATLIGCYAIKHYHFLAADLIAWMRLCRPGSVLGPQQFFLLEYQEKLTQKGERSPIWNQIKEKFAEDELTQSLKNLSIGSKGRMSEQQILISSQGELGQGNRLVDAKKKAATKNK